MMSTAALQLTAIHKSFPGVLALDNVSMALQAGSVHGLCGENGAGKSTLLKIATGALLADRGTLHIAGELIASPSRRLLQGSGVRAIYQERQIAADLSVSENIFLDELPTKKGLVDWRALRIMASERLSALEIDINIDTPVRALSVAQLQMMEIARAVSSAAKVVVMDEPTASLSRHELEPLFRLINRLRDSGVAVLFISHHLDEVFRIADEITVMRDGKVVEQGITSSFTPSTVALAMFGRAMNEVHVGEEKDHRNTDILLSVENVSSRRLQDVSFQVAAGEIVAVTGGIGAGVSEVAQISSGGLRSARGQVTIRSDQGKEKIRGRRQALARGVAFLPADRKRQGLLLSRSVADNVVLGQQAFGRRPFWAPRRVVALAASLISQAKVKTPNSDVVVGTLSGGNQQKTMIGRWMGVDCKVLIFDEPTAGIDIASKFDIYAELRSLAETGCAILVCSTDFQEVGQIADRAFVMRSGRIVGVLSGHKVSENSLLEMEMSQ